MKLIVGLGNKGKKYEQTRHNIGFMAIDSLANCHNISVTKEKFGGLYEEYFFNNEKIILVKPQKYINLSGQVIKEFVSFFKINKEDILIINDDLDMPIGKYKFKYKGSSGGHNGLKDIENQLQSSEYKRFKIGISNDKKQDTKDYVLGKFSKSEKAIVDEIIKNIPKIIDDYLLNDFDFVMNKYN